jgi:porin
LTTLPDAWILRSLLAQEERTVPGGRFSNSRLRRSRGARRFAILIVAATSLAEADAAEIAKTSNSIWQRDTLTGDWGGARSALKARGLDVTIVDSNEFFSVTSGGIKRATSYEGRTEFTIDADLEKLWGVRGAATHATVFQLRNGGYTAAESLGSISDPSNIDALATTRLFTAWFQQTWMDDRVSLRIGQLAADDEFLTSPTAGGLINGTFGWADIHAADMLSGGPAFPLATPGARLAVKATDSVTMLGAVFSGDPAGSNCTDRPQKCNRYGTTFSFSGGALAIGEIQYAINQGKDAVGLPGVYKVGAWYANGDYQDVHYGLGAGGVVVSLGLDSTATPLTRRGDHGFYAVADQTVWRGGDRSLALFVRGGITPQDRNPVSGYIDGGAGFKGFVPGRPDDVLTLGVAYAKLSGDLATIDAEAGNVRRDHELVLEASYSAQIAPWWTIQPDIQYIVHPNGGQNPADPTLRLENALVLGLRSVAKF